MTYIFLISQTIRGFELASSTACKTEFDEAKLHVLPAILCTQTFNDNDTSSEEDDEKVTFPESAFIFKHLDLFHSSAFTKCLDLNNLLEGLAKRYLTLETLSVQLKPNEKNVPLNGNPRGSSHGSIDRFLESVGKTLKILKIFRPPVGAPFSRFLEFCNMSALTELYLSGTVASSFEFLNRTPNLRKLSIDLECFKYKDRIDKIIEDKREVVEKYQKYPFDMALFAKQHEMEGVFLDKLEYLEIDYEFKELELLAKWMPNLTTLKTMFNDATFTVACELCGKYLTELVCMYGSTLHNHTLCKNISNLKCK